MSFLRLLLVVGALGAAAVAARGAERIPPRLDTRRVINDSYNFRTNQEPEMTEDEYALYQKIVAMIAAQPDFALKLLEQVLSGPGRQSPAFEFVLGNLYFSNHRPDLAEQHYRIAVGRLPTFARAWSNLGALYYSQARYAEAGECLVRTIEGGERDARTLGLLAFCLEKTGRKTAAEMDYLQALGLDPDNPDYLEGLSQLYFESKRYAQAEALLAQLVTLRPQERRHWMLSAAALTQLDRRVDAIAALEAADGLGLLDREGLAALGELYAQERFYPEATATFVRLRGQSADLGAEHLLAFVRALIGSNQLDAAGQALAAINFELTRPQQILRLQAQADLSAAREQWTEAKAPLEALLALDPLNGRALLSLGRACKAQGDLARADALFESAARQPEFAHRACLEIADDAVRTRRYHRSLEYLERAAAIAKTPVVQQYIARIKLLLDQETAPGSP